MKKHLIRKKKAFRPSPIPTRFSPSKKIEKNHDSCESFRTGT